MTGKPIDTIPKDHHINQLQTMGYDVERLIEIVQIRTTDRGWWIVTYPRNPDAILILKNPVEKALFLKDCKAESIEQVKDVPLKYYRLASRRVYRHD